jgi:hypothetical protein
MTHINSNSPGMHKTVLTRKNGVQPSRKAILPPQAYRIVRPTPASDDSSAYCVAVKATLHSPDR